MLSATFVRSINAPDRDGHGGLGLTLRIKPASREEYCKSRAHGIRINGRKTKLGLGTHPVGTLAMEVFSNKEMSLKEAGFGEA
ncbi:MAG: DUF4102 domain-containing protein, partial [Gammaproteobacteria bacterium]|nr:DUF4102 domain-containing protein [Gammaproteobacteria bacterium]MYK84128.1 DUF4102 domain-containing protein [Gammaproteobacteria bacterium]